MKLCILIAILLLPLMAGGQATFYWDGHEIEQRENGEIYWVIPMVDYIVLHHDSIDAFVDSVMAEREETLYIGPYGEWDTIPPQILYNCINLRLDTITVCDTVYTRISQWWENDSWGLKYEMNITCRDSLVRKE